MIELNGIIKPTDRILVVAPHPDDETIGLGGLLILYGKQIDVLVLTDGSKGNHKLLNLTKEQLIETRKKELQKALAFTKVVNIKYLGIEDGEVVNNKKTVSTFNFSKYDYVFVPNRAESHKDHKFAFKYIYNRINKCKTNLVEYEVWSPISNPNCFLDISEVFNTKKQMLDVYKTQTVSNNYIQMVSGLNLYRGLLIHKEFAEAYYLSTESAHHAIIRKIVSLGKKLVYANE